MRVSRHRWSTGGPATDLVLTATVLSTNTSSRRLQITTRLARHNPPPHTPARHRHCTQSTRQELLCDTRMNHRLTTTQARVPDTSQELRVAPLQLRESRPSSSRRLTILHLSDSTSLRWQSRANSPHRAACHATPEWQLRSFLRTARAVEMIVQMRELCARKNSAFSRRIRQYIGLQMKSMWFYLDVGYYLGCVLVSSFGFLTLFVDDKQIDLLPRSPILVLFICHKQSASIQVVLVTAPVIVTRTLWFWTGLNTILPCTSALGLRVTWCLACSPGVFWVLSASERWVNVFQVEDLDRKYACTFLSPFEFFCFGV